MEFIELLNKRYSCRSFKDEKISNEVLNELLKVISYAPSACNFQPVKVFVIDDPILLEKLDLATKFRFGANCVLMVCHDDNISWKRKRDNKDHGIIDSSIISVYLMEQAYNLNLGTTYVSAFNDELIHELFNLPQNYKVNCLLPIGYPSLDSKPSDLHYDRKELKEIVSFNFE